MGIFDFFKDKGRDAESKAAETTTPEMALDETIATMLEAVMPGQIDGLDVAADEDGNVTLKGTAADAAAREKAILLAGNTTGVASVNDDHLEVEADDVPEPRFYTIERGDSLSKVAKEVYGDAMKWQALFEANREIIEDPDLIYPGQRIRIPELG
jgi:nucleoid-associated protein YgaU